MRLVASSLAVLSVLAPVTSLGQVRGPIAGIPPTTAATTAAVNAPRVNADRTITFRIAAPQATKVELLFGEPAPQRWPLTRGPDGVWSITTEPQLPGAYRYSFSVDGLAVPDMHNPAIELGRARWNSLIDVPASPPRFDQARDVPHGVVHIREYRSRALQLQRRVVVWVPPQYDREPGRRFPVLYLRHGNGDSETGWSGLGRAGVIVENLIAEGKALPMILVMPNGYPSDSGAGSTAEGIEAVTRELIEDIVPLIDGTYRTLADADHRALAGLSMGAGQSFVGGLRNLATFRWIGAFSSGVISDPKFDLAAAIPNFLNNPAASNQRVRLLFLSCGTEDPRDEGYQRLMQLLKTHGIHYQWFSTPGDHEWKVWRHSLADLAPRLFRQPG